ncbi:hypothetical protein CJ030_MR1G016840 [Morella rubra]|uniref:Uncharacterized protein n=1 Tax=Morella rubra TaxID=262757 RepID=A0A6A1WPU9_9ROSI|nr:hypothetical protein CJ030_MR1G016840 [Morella rubra]
MMSDESIGAFYIDYATDFILLETWVKKVYGSCLGFGLPEWYKIRSIDSCITRKINKDPDDNSKWYAYSHAIVYEAHVDEKLNSRSFDGIRPDYDEFVEFVYHFETDEGLLKPPLVLRAPKDYSLGP